MMNELDRIFDRTSNAAEYAAAYLEHLAELLKKLNAESIAKFIAVIESARETGNTIFFVGNGGSAATASHFANDIAIGTRSWHKPFKAMSLCDNVAVMTAIGNDDGYDNIFVQQLQIHLTKDDVLVAISASGNSPNVVKAVDYAKGVGATTIGLTGFDGGQLARNCDLNVHAASEKGEYGPVEDIHMILDHLVGTYLARRCRKTNAC
ncbi:MAG: SIS domain-containing protein [Desulfovibrio sp.]